MEDFFLHQRYTSQGEPELGVGVVTETTKGKVRLNFPACNEMRLYAMESAPLRRVVFKAGDEIVDTKNQTMLIKRVALAGELYMYYGIDRQISEKELGNVTEAHGVDDRLLMGDVDTPQSFSLRRETLQYDYKRRLSEVKGMVGGRIDLIPHQLFIAHEVSSRYAPRVLLSDQVGLGKTIEACLILHRLLLSGRISRVLILVPESLVHQWFVEVLRRFNLWFNIFDEDRCASLDGNAPDGNPFLDNQLILCSTEFLAASPKRAEQALSSSWDMLVVDEAHHLEWAVDKVSSAYAVVEALSKLAKGLLLLTATPEQLGVESHFARLRLLDPVRYTNFEDFINESSDVENFAQKIAGIVEQLYLGKKLKAKETELLSSLFSKERIASLQLGGDLAKEELIEDLLDQYGPGRVLFRNTRAAMSGFPKRKALLIPLKAAEDAQLWEDRLTREFEQDFYPMDASIPLTYWFEEDPRVEWLLDTIRELFKAKVLLICKSKEKVLALEAVLSRFGNVKVAIFHEDLTIVQRDKNAAWFAEMDGAQILLCSEIGSEGRNFQFAHHLILFDLPLHSELLEQRIGRLDRIGQTEEINIYIPYLVNTPQHLLMKWFHEGLNAFEENLEGGNEFSKRFSDRLLSICKSNATSERLTELQALIHETSLYRKELRIKLAEGRDSLLEMNSFRPLKAQALVTQIQVEDNDRQLEHYFTKVLNHFDVEMEDLAHRSYFLQPASELIEVFPSIPPQGICVTFDRKRALSREDMSFLSWDHPMTTGAIDMVLSSGTGSASFGVLRGAGSPGLLMEFLFVLETKSDQSIYVDRFLPNTPLRIVVDHTGKEQTEEYSVELLNKNLIPGSIEPLLDNDTLVETMLPNMINAAKKIAEKRSAVEIEKGLQRMNHTLNHEIERLKTLQKKNKNIRAEEIQTALSEQLTLTTLIQNARLRMDAIQLILKK